MQHAVLQLDQRFRRSTGHLYVRTGKIEHIRRGVDGAQHPVSAQQTALKGGCQPVGKHDLENLALMDGVLCLFHHCAVGSFVKKRGHLAQQPACGFLLLGAGLQQLRQLLQPKNGFVVVRFQRIRLQRHIHDEHDLLPQIVKGDDLIKKHQVHILEAFGILRSGAGFRLAVTKVIVGKVAHKTAGEGGQLCKARAFVLCKDLPQRLRGILRFKGELPGFHHAVAAGDLHFGVKPQKGVASPLFAGLGTFQQVTVGGNVFQDLQRLNGRADVG